MLLDLPRARHRRGQGVARSGRVPLPPLQQAQPEEIIGCGGDTADRRQVGEDLPGSPHARPDLQGGEAARALDQRADVRFCRQRRQHLRRMEQRRLCAGEIAQ